MNVKMKRAMYKIDTELHKKLMKKLIADNMTFNEFINRVIHMYLENEYNLKQGEEGDGK